jgi:MFS family permease
LPVFAKDVLHIGPEGFGLLRAAPAVGAAIVAILLASRPIHRKAGVWMFTGVAIFGAATVVFGLSKILWLSLLALAVLGAADMVSVYIRQTLVQLVTPDHMRGRVATVSSLFIGASNELGEFESGVVARFLGPIGAALFGGIGAILVTGAWAWRFPALRKADRLE